MPQYKYHPKTKEELIEAIKKEIYEIQGTPDNPNWEADLNCIDTSQITDMGYLFSGNPYKSYELGQFNGDISQWNVSNVRDMEEMFVNSKFNGDIGNWDCSDRNKIGTRLENISANYDFSRLPDKIISVNTLKRIMEKKIPSEKWIDKIDNGLPVIVTKNYYVHRYGFDDIVFKKTVKTNPDYEFTMRDYEKINGLFKNDGVVAEIVNTEYGEYYDPESEDGFTYPHEKTVVTVSVNGKKEEYFLDGEVKNNEELMKLTAAEIKKNISLKKTAV